MKTAVRLLLWLALVSLLAAVIVATVGAAWLRHDTPDALLLFGDQVVTAREMHMGHWLVGVLGIALALMIVFTVVPLALLLALLVAGAGATFGLAVAVLSLAWVTAPLWIIGALLWWALRGRKPSSVAA